MLYSCSCFRVILKINQGKRLRDPKWGCISEPFDFVEAARDKSRV